jgi:hypothetical protein
MEIEGIRAFCHSICGENEDGRDVYVRMRAGTGRSRATTIASGIQASGESPISLAYDLERRYTQLASESPVWLEAVLEGTSKVIDTLKLPAYDAEAMTPFTALTENTGFSEVGVRLVEAVVALSRDANERATLSQHMFLESQANTMKIWRALAQAQAEKMVLENFEASDTMSEALGVLAPLVPALASRIGSASPAPDKEDAELDYEAAADQMVNGLSALAAERPDLITPERISKLANLVG